MSSMWEGCGPSKPKLKLKGKIVTIEDIGVVDCGFKPAMQYRKKTTYEFKTEELAMEYYYKKK